MNKNIRDVNIIITCHNSENIHKLFRMAVSTLPVPRIYIRQENGRMFVKKLPLNNRTLLNKNEKVQGTC